MPEPTIEQKFENATLELKRITDEVKRTADDIKSRDAAGQKVSEELKQKADEQLTAMNAVNARLADIEKKMARTGEEDEDAARSRKSIGDFVVTNADVIDFMARKTRGSVKVDVKAITSLTTDADGSAGAAIAPDRVPGIQRLAVRRMTVRNLLAPGRTLSNLIEYVQETGFTNLAAPVAEGAQKPESTLKLALRSAPVRTIAHFMYATKQILDDAPGLASLIDFRLRYGLQYAEELQLLNGDGTGQNIDGLIANATAFSSAVDVEDPTFLDVLRLAMLQAVLAEYPATGHVLNPLDWAKIELTKDTTGRYIVGNPQGTLTPTMWGLPVVATPAMAADKFLTGGFEYAAQIFDREDANVEISTEDRDNFIKNMVTIRGEERLALAVYRPEALIYGDFSDAVTSITPA